MTIALCGDLRDFSVADVLRLIAGQKKSGRLRLSGESGSLLVAFEGGAILKAFPGDRSEDRAQALADRLRDGGDVAGPDLEACHQRLLRDSLFDVLGWRSGHFEFEAQNGLGASACASGSEVEGLLHEVESQRALADAWGKDLPGENARLACTATRGRLSLSGIDPATRESAIAVLGAVVSGSCVREVIEGSKLGSFEASRSIVALLRAGILRVETRSEEPRVRRPGSASAAIVGPIAALFAVVSMMLVAGSDAVRSPEPFERARALFEESAERNRAGLLVDHEGAPEWVALGSSVR